MKGMRRFLWVPFVILVCAYLFLTPSGALRLGVVASGSLGEAFTLRVAQKSGPDESGTLYYTLQEPIVVKQTGLKAEEWAIYRNGIFRFAQPVYQDAGIKNTDTAGSKSP